MGDGQRRYIVRVQLTGVAPSVRLGHIDNDEVGTGQADPLISLDVHGNRPDTGSQDTGPVLPDQHHRTKVGDLE